jgi:hypothetical protein
MSGSGTLCRSVFCQKTYSCLIEVSVQRSVHCSQVRKKVLCEDRTVCPPNIASYQRGAFFPGRKRLRSWPS